ATPTSTPTATPTATPTPIPTIQVGDLSVPDPRVTNPELFDLTHPDAPIPQFVRAMREVGITLDPAFVAENLGRNYQLRQGPDGKPCVLTVYRTENKPYAMAFIAEQNEKGEWKWRRAQWHDITNIIRANSGRDFMVAVGIDEGDENHNDPLYLTRAFEGNTIWITGGLMHSSIGYGRTYVPQVLHEYHRRFPNNPATLGFYHMFWHHDQIPQLNTAEETRNYMRQRVREVLTILAPFLRQYNDRIIFNLTNEAMAGFGGSHNYVGWVEHSGNGELYPYYKFFGDNWITEAYLAFEDVRREMGLPRENFTLLVAEYGIDLPGRKSEFYEDRLRTIKQRIAQELGISWKQVQLDIGIQCNHIYDSPYEEEYYRLMATENGRVAIASNINALAINTNSKVFFLEVNYKDNSLEHALELLDLARRVDNLGGFQHAGLRINSDVENTYWDIDERTSYPPTAAYYAFFDFLLNFINN
ncbi:MAG: hypothetical protein ACPLPV_04195, partial [Methanomassiliicoccales archaeon]